MEKLAPGMLTLEVRPSAFLGLNRALSALCGLIGQPRSLTGTWRIGGELGFAQRELGWRWEKSLLGVCGPRHVKEEHGLKFKAPGVCSQMAEASSVHTAPLPRTFLLHLQILEAAATSTRLSLRPLAPSAGRLRTRHSPESGCTRGLKFDRFPASEAQLGAPGAGSCGSPKKEGPDRGVC